MHFISRHRRVDGASQPSGMATFSRCEATPHPPWNIALMKFHGTVNSAKLNSSRWEKLNEIPSFEKGLPLSRAARPRVRVWRCIAFRRVSPPRTWVGVNDLGSVLVDSDVSYADFPSSLRDGMERGARDCWIVPRELIATMSLEFWSIVRPGGKPGESRIPFYLFRNTRESTCAWEIERVQFSQLSR